MKNKFIEIEEFIPPIEIFGAFKRRVSIFLFITLISVILSTLWSYKTKKQFIASTLINCKWTPHSRLSSDLAIKEILRQPASLELIGQKYINSTFNIKDFLKIRTTSHETTLEIVSFGKSPEQALANIKAAVDTFTQIQHNSGMPIMDKAVTERNVFSIHYPQTTQKRNHKLDIVAGIFIGLLLGIQSVLIPNHC